MTHWNACLLPPTLLFHVILWLCNFNFFETILSLTNLTPLKKNISESYVSVEEVLFEAAVRMCDQSTRPSMLRSLDLVWEQGLKYYGEEYLRCKISFALLEYFSDCHSIESIYFWIPAAYWRNREFVSSWRKLVSQTSQT